MDDKRTQKTSSTVTLKHNIPTFPLFSGEIRRIMFIGYFSNLMIFLRTSRKQYANKTLHKCSFQIAQNGGSQIYENVVFGFL